MLMTSLVVVNDRVRGSFFFFVLVLLLSLTPTSSPAALYFECWLDTELANRLRKKRWLLMGGAIIVINFNSKLVQRSKE
jgi:hypothetical protein